MKIFLPWIAAFCLWCPTLACSVGPAQESSDPAWPLQIDRGDSRILVYQLQPESLSGDELSARAAVSITRTKDAEPIFGAVWIEARIATDRDARTVTLLDVKVPTVRFPAATESERNELVEVVKSQLPSQHPTFSLDEMIATLDPAVQAEPLATDLSNEPPRIVFVTKPTALVTIDGKPELREVENSQLMRVVNTPFILLFDPAQKTYYLDAGGHWRKASAIEGPWQDEAKPPAAVTSALPKPAADSDVGAPPAAIGAIGTIGEDVDVMVVTQPTELIVSRGEARWTPLEGSELLYLANSENDAFLESATHVYYVLLAGRWYSNSSLDKGTWTYVAADQLPKAFERIPADSEKAGVRTFVAGTDEAREAVLDASIPQTTAIQRSDAHCSVTYDGEPKFEAIAGTPLRYAVNTSSSVIEYDAKYYCCSDGVWYVAATPSGPWTLCTEVPDAIYTLPPSCPIYPVRYVYVYDSTPEYVWVGYLPGYTGCYVAGPTIVYGTGFWYHGWIGHAYYPRPWTWGFCPHYDPWFCGWNFGFGFAWGVSPWWFGHSCGWGHPGWWGPGGFHGRNFEIHGAVVKHTANPSLRNGAAAGPPRGRENLYNRDENRSRVAAVSGVGARSLRSAPANDVFTDRDGRVMRRTPDGWEERQQSQWKRAAPQPTPPESRGPAAGRLPPAPSRERPVPTPPPTRDGQPAPVRPPAPQGVPDTLEPPQGRPTPDLPPSSRPLPPQLPPDLRPPPFTPRQGLRPLPSPGDSFEGMRRARERGNARSSFLRQRPMQGGGRRGG